MTPAPTLAAISATIKEGEKSKSLVLPDGWHATRTLAASPDGSEYAFIGNNGEVYQGRTGDVSPQALAFGYAFGAKQKADSDGAKDKGKTAETAQRITGIVGIEDWITQRTGGGEGSTDPMALQVKAILMTKLAATKLAAAIKAKGIKRTGFSGGVEVQCARYFAIVEEAMGRKPDEATAKAFIEKVRSEAVAALEAVGGEDEEDLF